MDNLTEPMFTVRLDRNTIDIGQSDGLLSIGEFPEGVGRDDLTWAPLRGYSMAEGGLAAPTASPNEVYPLAWEIFIDDVYFDGELLPRSNLSSPDIQLSGLVDTGNSLIRGPEDLVAQINQRLGGERFPCSVPHSLAFSIGGKMFPVDPRDFVRQAVDDSVELCQSNMAVADPPTDEGNGYRFSWSLGDPFLRSVIASFYYGNITHPSQDPPQMGFLSTVPEDAPARLVQAVEEASRTGGNFLGTVNRAPSGTQAVAISTDPAAVGNAAIPSLKVGGGAVLTLVIAMVHWLL